jgi:hypothetical protein
MKKTITKISITEHHYTMLPVSLAIILSGTLVSSQSLSVFIDCLLYICIICFYFSHGGGCAISKQRSIATDGAFRADSSAPISMIVFT